MMLVKHLGRSRLFFADWLSQLKEATVYRFPRFPRFPRFAAPLDSRRHRPLCAWPHLEWASTPGKFCETYSIWTTWPLKP